MIDFSFWICYLIGIEKWRSHSPARIRMIKIDCEKTFLVAESLQMVGHSPQVVRRWCTKGRRGTDGEIRFLDYYWSPSGRRCTSREAIIRFTQQLNGMSHGQDGTNNVP